MNRTHAFFVIAAALTLTTLIEPGKRTWKRFTTSPPPLASTATTGPGTLQLAATANQARPLEGQSFYVRYDIKAGPERASDPEAKPVELVLAIDRSGSMAGQKLDRAKAAANSLIDLLGARDRLAIVTFDGSVTSLELTATDEAGKARLHQFVNDTWDRGSTNISAALDEARRILAQQPESDATRRVVLMSDGQPTDGITSEAGLVQLVNELHGARIAVSALGVGTDYNGKLMQHLAEHGGGYYAYLNDPSRLTEVLALELQQARGAVASRATLTLELPESAELVQVAGRDVDRHGKALYVSLPDFAPGQTAQVFVELKALPGAGWAQVQASLSYFDLTGQSQIHSKRVDLAMQLTDDAAVADASKDEGVTTDCLRAIGATQMVAAAAAFERGDRASAFAFIDRARGIFAMSADSLAGELTDTAVTQDRWKQTHDPEAIRDEVLGLERKKMASFGMANSY